MRQKGSERSGAALSLGKSVRVRGYDVRRLPLGEYLRAIEALGEMPGALLEACFPGMDAAQALAQLRQIDARGLGEIAMRALSVAPGEAVRLLSLLTGVSEEALLGDPQIGLDGAAEMAEAAFALNGVENFIRAVGRLAAQIRRIKSGAASGFSG